MLQLHLSTLTGPPARRCDVLVVYGVPRREVEPIIGYLEWRGVSFCAEQLTLLNYTAVSRFEARVAVLVAHGADSYLSLSTRADPLTLLLALPGLEARLYAVMDTPDGSLLAVRSSVLLRLLRAERIVAVTCTNLGDPRVVTYVRRPSIDAAAAAIRALEGQLGGPR